MTKNLSKFISLIQTCAVIAIIFGIYPYLYISGITALTLSRELLFKIIAVYFICLVLSPPLSMLFYVGGKPTLVIFKLFGIVFLSGASLIIVYPLDIIFGSNTALFIAVIIPCLLMGILYSKNGMSKNYQTITRLTERGVKPSEIIRSISLKNAYSSFLENTGHILSASAFLFLVTKTMVWQNNDASLLYIFNNPVPSLLSIIFIITAAWALGIATAGWIDL